MANITEESEGLKALLEAAEKAEKSRPHLISVPSATVGEACDMDDDECLSCGS